MALVAVGGSYVALSVQAAKNSDGIARLEATSYKLGSSMSDHDLINSALGLQLAELRGEVSANSNINLESIRLLKEIQKAVTENKLGTAINSVKIEALSTK